LDSKIITRGALIAAMYAILTVNLGPLGFSQVQFRVSEMFMVLACFDIAAVPGLWIGCVLANAIGIPLGFSFGMLDVTLGAAMTLLAAMSMWKIGPRWPALAMPVLFNAFGIAVVLSIAGGFPYWPSVLWVGVGETAVMVVLGVPLFIMLRKRPSLIGLERQYS
jgi:uncharacterized membrane protein